MQDIIKVGAWGGEINQKDSLAKTFLRIFCPMDPGSWLIPSIKIEKTKRKNEKSFVWRAEIDSLSNGLSKNMQFHEIFSKKTNNLLMTQ